MKLEIVGTLMVIFAIKLTLPLGSSMDIQNEPGSEVIGVMIDNHTIKITHTTKNIMDNLTFTTFANVSYASDLDFFNDNSLIYTDTVNKKILSLNIHTGNIRPIIQEGLEEPCAIVVDPLKKKFYFIDGKRHTLEMANLDGSDRKVIIHRSFKEPKDIALDPNKGFLFVGDAGSNLIERFDINAQYQRTVIIENTMWPNGLTLDLKTKRIYFVEGRGQKVMSCKYDGKDLHSINSEDDLLFHPSSIFLFRGYLYITDYGKLSLMSFEMSGKKNATEIATNLVMPNYFGIFEMATSSKELHNTDLAVGIICVVVIVLIIMSVLIWIAVLKRKQIVSLWNRFKPCQYRQYNNPAGRQ